MAAKKKEDVAVLEPPVPPVLDPPPPPPCALADLVKRYGALERRVGQEVAKSDGYYGHHYTAEPLKKQADALREQIEERVEVLTGCLNAQTDMTVRDLKTIRDCIDKVGKLGSFPCGGLLQLFEESFPCTKPKTKTK